MRAAMRFVVAEGGLAVFGPQRCCEVFGHTVRLFARLSAISKSTRKCITIPRKTWSLPS